MPSGEYVVSRFDSDPVRTQLSDPLKSYLVPNRVRCLFHYFLKVLWVSGVCKSTSLVSRMSTFSNCSPGLDVAGRSTSLVTRSATSFSNKCLAESFSNRSSKTFMAPHTWLPLYLCAQDNKTERTQKRIMFRLRTKLDLSYKSPIGDKHQTYRY